MRARAAPGLSVSEDAVVWSIPGPRFARVALAHELRAPRLIPFRRTGRRWELRFERPAVDRLEYMLEVEHRVGGVERVLDPGSPLRAPGPFGDKSVVEFPGYARPDWVSDEESAIGDLRELTLASRLLRTSVEALVWSAAETDPEQPLPLLVIHDGPEYAKFSSLLGLFDHLVAFGELPSFRAALLPPPLDRNEMYSASARYAHALAGEWVPALGEAAPFTGRPIGMGASLGALAMLHAHWASPEVFGGLFLQSGSYFRRRFDAHESGFGHYERIARFVSTVAGGHREIERIPITFTCGTGEENHDNNRFIAATLQRQDWEAELVEHRDAHNWISWRDVFHPHLADLVLRVAG